MGVFSFLFFWYNIVMELDKAKNLLQRYADRNSDDPERRGGVPGGGIGMKDEQEVAALFQDNREVFNLASMQLSFADSQAVRADIEKVLEPDPKL